MRTLRAVPGALLSALVLALLPLLAACTGTAAPPDRAQQEVRAVLARWSAALLARDRARYTAEDGRAGAREGFDRLSGVPLASWEYAVSSVRVSGGRAYAAAELRYRIAGYDTVPATAAREVELVRHGDRWRVAADRPAAGARPQLWDQGPVSVSRGRYGLVLAVRSAAVRPELPAALAAAADEAVPAVSAAWPGTWPRKVLLVVPASVDDMAALLGSPASAYAGMAAVTTGRVGGGPGPADRVTVNAQAYGELGALGRRVVLTHETVHVATRSATPAGTPLWLSEGFADWVAYRGSGRSPAQAAPALARAVRRGEVPAALPGGGAFAFGGDADALAASYEGAWLACLMMAERWGAQAPAAFYAAAARSSAPAAFASVLGTDERTFTADWRAYLRERLG